jgi:hypothetical protein
MGMFDSLFGKSKAPTMPTLDINKALQDTADCRRRNAG